MLCVGIIGLGVGEHHLRAFGSHAGCRVECVCDLDVEKARSFAKRYSGIRVARDAEEVLEDPSLDIVSIASYDDAHAFQVERALERGRHVFVEKPLCLYPEEAARIRRLLRERPGLRLSSNLNLRACPRFRRLRARIAGDEFGDLFYLEADYLWGRKEKLTEGWRGRMDYYSLVLGASVHMVDLLLWLIGDRPGEVVSMGNNIATRGSGFRFDDFNVMLLRWENGLTAKVMSSGGCIHPHFHRLWIYGTKETVIHDMLAVGRMTSAEPGRTPEAVEGDYPAREEKDKLIASFVESVLDPHRQPLVTEDEVFNAMSVCFAAIESLERGERVKINYL